MVPPMRLFHQDDDWIYGSYILNYLNGVPNRKT